MLILAIDTAGKNGGIALARAEGDSFALLAEAPLAGGSYSAELVPKVQALLEQQKLALAQLDGFAVAAGPGSFTGLRVGLAAVKALADVLHKPIAAVSVLEAVAVLAGEARSPAVGSSIVALLDAGRNEAYLGEYRKSGTGLQRIRQLVVKRSELAELLRPPALLVTPDETIDADVKTLDLTARRVAMPGAADIARLGAAKLQAGETISAELLDADYIRRSDAELYSLPKL